MRVLLAEDNALNAELFVAALERDEHAVTLVGDGLTARARALEQDYDIVILDIHLPGLDGYSLCQELRAHGMKKPILALSASVMPEQVERGRAAGFDAYLAKPIAPADLRATVRRFAEAPEAG